jgi:hypothetical protein
MEAGIVDGAIQPAALPHVGGPAPADDADGQSRPFRQRRERNPARV